MKSLLQVSAELLGTAYDIEHCRQRIIELACDILNAELRLALGGTNRYGFAPLALSTLDRKSNDDYLRDTGAMAGSVETVIGHEEAWIGSRDEKIGFIERGTSRMPSRPIFFAAVMKCQGKIEGAVLIRTLAAST